MAAEAAKGGSGFIIKPEAVTPAIPTSEWPLLLKNYDKRKISLLLISSYIVGY